MKTILIVEDEANLRKLYQQELAEEKYKVITASNSKEAMKELESKTVNLVVLDLKLENENGLDLMREMLDHHRDIKVVINTAYSVYKTDFTTWSADAYLIKTSNLAELKSKIAELLSD
jgi:DNA-binding response OmpR family regulator